MKRNANFISYEGECEIKKTLYDIGERIEASDDLKKRIDCQLGNVPVKEEQNMKHLSIKKVMIGVAAACLLIGTVGIASSGARYWTSGSSAIADYTEFTDIAKVEAEVGYPVDAVEKFSNGFEFKGINVGTLEVHNEAGQVEDKTKEIYIRYQKGGKEIFNSIHKMFTDETASEKIPDKTLRVGEIEVAYNQYTYKFVPVDYELTEEDKKNMERDDYEISYGSDKVEIQHYAAISWVKDGIRYGMGAFDLSLSADEMLNMAKEVIESGNE